LTPTQPPPLARIRDPDGDIRELRAKAFYAGCIEDENRNSLQYMGDAMSHSDFELYYFDDLTAAKWIMKELSRACADVNVYEVNIFYKTI
jgi:hypothetical protein